MDPQGSVSRRFLEEFVSLGAREFRVQTKSWHASTKRQARNYPISLCAARAFMDLR